MDHPSRLIPVESEMLLIIWPAWHMVEKSQRSTILQGYRYIRVMSSLSLSLSYPFYCELFH